MTFDKKEIINCTEIPQKPGGSLEVGKRILTLLRFSNAFSHVGGGLKQQILITLFSEAVTRRGKTEILDLQLEITFVSDVAKI